MKYEIEIPDDCINSLQKELSVYNSRPGQDPTNVPLTMEQFLSTTLAPMCATAMKKFDIATTTDIQILRAAVKADPQAVKVAIETEEQRVEQERLDKEAAEAARVQAEKDAQAANTANTNTTPASPPAPPPDENVVTPTQP